ncbi:MAG TPA: hypothetical protein VGI08_09840, partial [Diaminobutyricibacter sp.]
DTGTGRVQQLGRLPAAVAHAQAFTLGGTVYVAGGGNANGNVVGSVTRIDPGSKRIALVSGSLPVSDAATVPLPGAALVIGGATSAGTTGAVHRVSVR